MADEDRRQAPSQVLSQHEFHALMRLGGHDGAGYRHSTQRGQHERH